MRILKGIGIHNPDTLILALLVAIALTRGTLYAVVTPPFDSPDEKGHFDYVASLYETRGADIQGKEQRQPPLYYWMSVPAYALFAHQPPYLDVYALATEKPSLLSLIAVRLISVLMTVATVPLAYWAAKTIRPKDSFVYLGTAAFVALVPAYGWLGASINNDNLANLVASFSIVMLLRVVSRGFSRGRLLVLAGLFAAAIAAKPTIWPITAAIAAALTIKALFPHFARRPRLGSIAVVVALAVAAVVLVGPAHSPTASFIQRWTKPNALSTHGVSYFFSNLDVWPFVYQFKTFWGSFSTDSVQLPPVVYWILAALTLASVIGLLRRAARVCRALANNSDFSILTEHNNAPTLILAAMVLLQWMLSFARFYLNDSLRPDQRIAGWDDDFAVLHGRFLFPVIIPIGFLLVWGLEAILPPNWSKHGTWVLMLVLIAVDWTALLVLANGGHSWQVYPGQG